MLADVGVGMVLGARMSEEGKGLKMAMRGYG